MTRAQVSAWAGPRIQGEGGEGSRGAETQESIGRRLGATRVCRERIRRRIKASKQAKLAETSGSASRNPGDSGSASALKEEP
jgi:hypothetical protein